MQLIVMDYNLIVISISEQNDECWSCRMCLGPNYIPPWPCQGPTSGRFYLTFDVLQNNLCPNFNSVSSDMYCHLINMFRHVSKGIILLPGDHWRHNYLDSVMTWQLHKHLSNRFRENYIMTLWEGIQSRKEMVSYTMLSQWIEELLTS